MNAQHELMVLKSEIKKTLTILDRIYAFYDKVNTVDIKILGKTRSAAMIVAQILENFYTCLETLFLRISQLFENSLCYEKWHADLLEKMNLSISGVRERAVSDELYGVLLELMRFRHFKRYYFELEYDRSKIDYLSGQYLKAHKFVKRDLLRFDEFLSKLTG